MSIGNCGSVGKGRETNPLMGLYMDIYRPASGAEFNLGGWSSRSTRCFVYGEKVPKIFTPDEGDIICKMTENVPGHLALSADTDNDLWTMFGGNFAYSSDSRMPNTPIKIMDRIYR